MEALRENAISGSPDLNGKLGDVMLAAPDIDLKVFRQQLARLDPSHVSVLVSSNDRALSISRTLAGDRPRLGGLNPSNPEDRAALEGLGVKTYDLSKEFDRPDRAWHLCRRTAGRAHDWLADHRIETAGCQCPVCARRKTRRFQKSQPCRSRHWLGRPAPPRTRVPLRRSSGAGVISGRSSLTLQCTGVTARPFSI